MSGFAGWQVFALGGSRGMRRERALAFAHARTRFAKAAVPHVDGGALRRRLRAEGEATWPCHGRAGTFAIGYDPDKRFGIPHPCA